MGLFALAIVMAAQAGPPPSAVVQTEKQLSGSLADLPCFDYEGAKHCVLSIVVSGAKKDMDAARTKLTSEGWPSTYRAGRSGTTVMEIDPKNRSLDDAWALTNRFSSREFGLLEAEFSTRPVPGSK
jgi:hypothetical protein